MKLANISADIINKYGDIEQPYLTPLLRVKLSDTHPLFWIALETLLQNNLNQFTTTIFDQDSN